jgi:hypothetical protein
MKRFCIECGHEIEEGRTTCPNCGCPVYDTAQNDSNDEEHYEDNDEPWYNTDLFSGAVTPLMRNFDNGKSFRIIAETAISLLSLASIVAAPLTAYYIYKNKIMYGCDTEDKILIMIAVIILLLMSLFSYSYWVKRISFIKLIFDPKDEYVVIPIGTYLFQWVGEWIALLSCVVACIIFILYFISFDSESLTLGWNYGCYFIATGFVLSFVFRLIAERMRAVASIANNTKQFKRKMKVVKNDNFEYQGLLNNFLYFVAIAVTLAYTLTALFE